MTCVNCGKELEVIKTDTGSAFLPCGCSPVNRLIVMSKIKGHCECDKFYSVPCLNCQIMIDIAPELGAALEIAIETLKDVRSEMSSQNVDRLWCIDQLSGSLEKINEVCK